MFVDEEELIKEIVTINKQLPNVRGGFSTN